MDNANFKQVLATLGETYGKTITPLMAKAYWSALKDYSNEQVEKAMVDYIADPNVSQFWPQAGALIAKITGTDKQQQTAIADHAANQWLEVVAKIRKQGAYGEVIFDDQVTMKAIQVMGGWRELCHTPVDKMEWRRKEFVETYRNSINASNLPDSLAGIGSKSQAKIESAQQLKRIQDKVSK